MKLVGGNMHPYEIQSKEKVINTSRSDEDNAVNVEDKLMGTLLIDSEIDKNYGDLKRLLINSMTKGHKHYSNSKVSA